MSGSHAAALALALVAGAAFAFAGDPPRIVPADPVVPFVVRMETTSDWADLRGPGVRTYERFGDLAVGGIDAREAPAAASGTIAFEIHKGDMGTATVTLGHGDGTPIAGARNVGKIAGDARNRWRFDVDAAPFLRPPHPPARREIAEGEERLALAAYYPWYGRPDGPSGRWVHWEPARRYASTRQPAAGYYDSLSKDVVATHCALAREAGLSGFLASWWGPGTHEDRAFPLLLAEAARAELEVAPYVERARDAADLVAQVRYLLERYASSPAALRIGGRPAIFLYARVVPLADDATLGALRRLAPEPFLVADGLVPENVRRFDGVHSYIALDLPPEAAGALYRAVARACAAEGKTFIATAIPGYDDTAARTPGTRLERRGTEVFHRWLTAALGSGADGLLVTSFNEWHEGTEIEPSAELGGEALSTLKEALAAWR